MESLRGREELFAHVNSVRERFRALSSASAEDFIREHRARAAARRRERYVDVGMGVAEGLGQADLLQSEAHALASVNNQRSTASSARDARINLTIRPPPDSFEERYDALASIHAWSSCVIRTCWMEPRTARAYRL